MHSTAKAINNSQPWPLTCSTASRRWVAKYQQTTPAVAALIDMTVKPVLPSWAMLRSPNKK